MNNTLKTILLFIFCALVSCSIFSQTISVMDNGMPATPSSVNLNLIGASPTSDVITCDTLLSTATPTNGFGAMCFNVLSSHYSSWVYGIGVVISSSVSASAYLQIYKRTGNVIGKNLSSAGWTFVDSVKVSKGISSLDTIYLAALTNTIYINGWPDTLGLFVGFKNPGPLTLKFRNGSALGAVYNQKACMRFFTGYAGASIFNATFTPRDFGGYLQFCCGLTSVKENSKKTDFKMYPNPASDLLTISVVSKHFYVEVHNILGEVVLRDRSLNPSKNIDIHNLSDGSYTVKLYTDDKKMGVKQLMIKR